jgi:pimeloyl-ACP methyl ester carboxylesterase
MTTTFQRSTIRAADATEIGYHSIGRGPGLIVVGGVLSTGLDYAGLALTLSGSNTVHLLDRRGRGLSGPQQAGHSMDDECGDLLAVRAATKAAAVFGHSFGGLVALETARQSPAFDRIIVYEPGVAIAGTQRLAWLDQYERRLATGDTRGAFACMVKGAGFAPAGLSRMPLWYVGAVLRLAVRGPRWQAMERLLETNLTEHRIQAALTTPNADRFRSIDAPVLLLGGQRSPKFTRDLLAHLQTVISSSEVELLQGLDHLAPEQKPQAIALAIRSHSKPGT